MLVQRTVCLVLVLLVAVFFEHGFKTIRFDLGFAVFLEPFLFFVVAIETVRYACFDDSADGPPQRPGVFVLACGAELTDVPSNMPVHFAVDVVDHVVFDGLVLDIFVVTFGVFDISGYF